MRLVIFGPQGAGKGTQSKRIAEKYGIASISTGDIFRWAISHETELGAIAKEHVETGHLVPDEITIGVVRERLSEADVADGFLLDGFPRNLDQARALDEILAGQQTALDAALVIEVREEVSLRRLLGRRVCTGCGRNYHIDSPPSRNWTCDTCGGEVVPRSDDNGSVIRERLKLYHDQTEPLKQFYEEKGILRPVDGLGTPDDVFDRIVAAL